MLTYLLSVTNLAYIYAFKYIIYLTLLLYKCLYYSIIATLVRLNTRSSLLDITSIK